MTNQLEYNVPGMTCGHCVNAITGEVKAVKGVHDVSIDLDTKKVVIIGDDLNDEAVRAAISEAGCEPEAGAEGDSCCG